MKETTTEFHDHQRIGPPIPDPAQEGMSAGDVKCIVPGCTESLSDSYCRKANTCYEHQKAKVLDVKGRPSRFCQQCVRVHDLARFDGDKRGCRKRLAQHNLRRKRKVAQKRLTKDLARQEGSACSLLTSMITGDSTGSGASEPTGIVAPADSFLGTSQRTYSCPADVPMAPNLAQDMSGKRTTSAGNGPATQAQPSNSSAGTHVNCRPAEDTPVPENANISPCVGQQEMPTTVRSPSSANHGHVAPLAASLSQPGTISAPQVSPAGGFTPTDVLGATPSTVCPPAGQNTSTAQQKMPGMSKPSNDDDWSQFAAEWDDPFSIPVDLSYPTDSAPPQSMPDQQTCLRSNQCGKMLGGSGVPSMRQPGAGIGMNAAEPSQQFGESLFLNDLDYGGRNAWASSSSHGQQMAGHGLGSCVRDPLDMGNMDAHTLPLQDAGMKTWTGYGMGNRNVSHGITSEFRTGGGVGSRSITHGNPADFRLQTYRGPQWPGSMPGNGGRRSRDTPWRAVDRDQYFGDEWMGSSPSNMVAARGPGSGANVLAAEASFQRSMGNDNLSNVSTARPSDWGHL